VLKKQQLVITLIYNMKYESEDVRGDSPCPFRKIRNEDLRALNLSAMLLTPDLAIWAFQSHPWLTGTPLQERINLG
jgi:hypothetical protein